MNVCGLVVIFRFIFGKFADLRPGETLNRRRAGILLHPWSEFLLQFDAFRIGRPVHPDWRGLAGERRCQLFRQIFRCRKSSEYLFKITVQINRTMLLPGTADAFDFRQRRMLFLQPGEQQIERGNPHQRVAMFDQRIGIFQKTVRTVVFRQVFAEIYIFRTYNFAGCGVNDLRFQTLRTAVQSQINAHWNSCFLLVYFPVSIQIPARLLRRRRASPTCARRYRRQSSPLPEPR